MEFQVPSIENFTVAKRIESDHTPSGKSTVLLYNTIGTIIIKKVEKNIQDEETITISRLDFFLPGASTQFYEVTKIESTTFLFTGTKGSHFLPTTLTMYCQNTVPILKFVGHSFLPSNFVVAIFRIFSERKNRYLHTRSNHGQLKKRK